MIVVVKWGSFRGCAQNAVIEVGDAEAAGLITLGAVEPYAEAVGRQVGEYVAGSLKAARRDVAPIALAAAVGEIIRRAVAEVTRQAREEIDRAANARRNALTMKAFADLAICDGD